MHQSEKQKRMRKAMRDLVSKAYERELSQSLSGLESQFKLWRDGGISCFRLNDLIHEHHDGVSRDLWKKYGFNAEMLLPSLVAKGVILESEVPEELLAEMRPTIQSMREFEKNWPEVHPA
jgi:hypothetical protein